MVAAAAVGPAHIHNRRGGVGSGWWSLGATTASRAESTSSVEAAPAASASAAAGAAAAAAAAVAHAPAAPEPVQMDPFRPSRAAVDPVVINILVKILGSGEDAERVANKAVRKRMRNPETVRDCVRACGRALVIDPVCLATPLLM